MRIALTGAATGIGASVASKLKERGDEIIAFDLNEPVDNVDQWIRTDLNDPASISAALGDVEGEFDALINNAGLPPREGMAQSVLQVNYFGLKDFSMGMTNKLKPGSAIVNTASRAGAMWRENIDEVKALMAVETGDDLATFLRERRIDHVRAYNLSKEAVIAFTLAETETLIAKDLRMNAVSPAAVSTNILDDFKKAFGVRVDQAISRVGRAGAADEIADVIVFLASPQSRWIKGQDITIDGGMTAMATSDALALNGPN